MAMLLISSDLPEIVTLADRIAVMNDFTIRGELANDHDYSRMSQAIIRLIHSGPAREQTGVGPDRTDTAGESAA